MTINLPVVSCEGCGACCMHVVMPPFLPDFHMPENENEEFTEFKRKFPKLAADLKAEYERKMREDDWPENAPCLWYDQENKRCRHYEARPDVCREFEMGGEFCLAHREANHIP